MTTEAAPCPAGALQRKSSVISYVWIHQLRARKSHSAQVGPSPAQGQSGSDVALLSAPCCEARQRPQGAGGGGGLLQEPTGIYQRKGPVLVLPSKSSVCRTVGLEKGRAAVWWHWEMWEAGGRAHTGERHQCSVATPLPVLLLVCPSVCLLSAHCQPCGTGGSQHELFVLVGCWGMLLLELCCPISVWCPLVLAMQEKPALGLSASHQFASPSADINGLTPKAVLTSVPHCHAGFLRASLLMLPGDTLPPRTSGQGWDFSWALPSLPLL